MKSLKEHWESVYSDPAKLKHTWTQAVPDRTLMLIERMHLDKSAPIIDVGGGDSVLVDHLLELGYTNITVLDISEKAIERSRDRLGPKASQVNWVVSNVLEYSPDRVFACWIDRATFHFLQSKEEIEKYVSVVDLSTKAKSHLIISTFSEIGPAQCSGLPVQRYNTYTLTDVYAKLFNRKWVFREDHVTPARTLQQFIYIGFEKRSMTERPDHSIQQEELFLSDLSDENLMISSCGIDGKGCC